MQILENFAWTCICVSIVLETMKPCLIEGDIFCLNSCFLFDNRFSSKTFFGGESMFFFSSLAKTVFLDTIFNENCLFWWIHIFEWNFFWVIVCSFGKIYKSILCDNVFSLGTIGFWWFLLGNKVSGVSYFLVKKFFFSQNGFHWKLFLIIFSTKSY